MQPWELSNEETHNALLHLLGRKKCPEHLFKLLKQSGHMLGRPDVAAMAEPHRRELQGNVRVGHEAQQRGIRGGAVAGLDAHHPLPQQQRRPAPQRPRLRRGVRHLLRGGRVV